jgi:hypothetical protein
VVPVTPPSSGSDPAIQNVQLTGPHSGTIALEVVQPLEVTGHQYEISFFDTLEAPYESARYWRIRDVTMDNVLLDSMSNVFGTLYDPNAVTPLVDGFSIELEAEQDPTYNQELSGWTTDTEDEFGVSTTADMEPYDFQLQFPDYPNNVDQDTNGVQVPYTVFNLTISEYHQTEFYDVDNDGTFSQGDSVQVYGKYTPSTIFSFVYLVESSSQSLEAGDVFQVTTNKPFQMTNKITFSTIGPRIARASVDVSKVKVVPNPYYIRADWDLNKYTNYVMFTNLPEKCTIRIFTVSGIFIKEIQHDASSNDENAMGGSHIWNLRNLEELKIASGLYIFQVDSEYGEYVGKFAVVR